MLKKQEEMGMTTIPEKKRRERKVFSARDKSQAVLSLWSGRRKPSAICRSLSINWATLDGWQRRAVNGMLRTLGPMETAEAAPGLELDRRLERLLTGTAKTPESAIMAEAKAE